MPTATPDLALTRKRLYEVAGLTVDPDLNRLVFDFVRKLEAEFLSLDSDDLDFGVVVGRVELGRKSPLEAGQQSLFDVLQLHGRFIRGKDQLFACQLQVVEYVEEGVLGAGFSRELLDVVIINTSIIW